MKYWKGQHVICVTPKLIEEHLRSARLTIAHFIPLTLSFTLLSSPRSAEYKKPTLTVDASALKWNPPKKSNKAKKLSAQHSLLSRS